METPTNRGIGAAVAVSLLLLLAGCSGGFGPGEGTTETTAAEPTTGGGTTDAANETSPDETTAETTTVADTTTANRTTAAPDANDSATTGRLLVVLDGRDVHLDGPTAPSTGNASTNGNGSVWLDANDSHAWHAANESLPVADLLAELGMDADVSSVTYDGTTYRDGNDTTVSYRVNGEVVDDPDAYAVEDGDEVFVTVHTANASTPGRYFDASHPHPHGTLTVTVGGTPVNFTEQKYVHADRYFHFHGDEAAERWHGHSMNLTPAYAVSTFPGLNLTNDALTYDNETYWGSDENVTVSVTVNGEPVDPTEYVLKDGDDLRVAVEGSAVETENETTNETSTATATGTESESLTATEPVTEFEP